MAFSKPAPTTYLQPSPDSKTIDLLGLLRRLCAEYQYHDLSDDGNLAEIEKFESATSNQRVLKLIEEKLDKAMVPPFLPWEQPGKKEVTEFLNQLPVTRYAIKIQVDTPKLSEYSRLQVLRLKPKRVTAKDFKYVKTTPEGCPNVGNLSDEEIRRMYWRLRSNRGDAAILVSLGVIIEWLKKWKFTGFLLPNGKVVPFEALHSFVLFSYVPKELNLFEYSLPWILQEDDKQSHSSEVTELNSAFIFGPNAELVCHHFVMAINLPEEDAQGKLGRMMIIDPTCAQFGMEGTNGELVYWGDSEEYVKLFPAKEIHFGDDQVSYKPYDHRKDEICPVVLDIVKATLANLKLISCGYCGDVPRKNEDGETKLKTCSRCKKAFYCDVLCQKMAWKGHKLECKAESK